MQVLQSHHHGNKSKSILQPEERTTFLGSIEQSDNDASNKDQL